MMMIISKFLVGAALVFGSTSAWGSGFNDNGNGTVTDFATGLMWQQSDAQNEIGLRYFRDEARAYCEDLLLAGKNDWRLPEVKELVSLVDYRRRDPAIELIAFPDARGIYYWSATPRVDHPSSDTLAVSFSRGVIDYLFIDENFGGVRCVRSA